jgi:AcrR family transcriptional regulator
LSTPAESRLGLRERKKARTRATVQAHALRLFRERGYDATSVEMICDAAEVSPATFYRYFPAKADVVLWDEFDPLIVAAFRAQPAGQATLAALRAAFRTVFAQMTAQHLDEQQQRSQLMLEVPELRAAMTDQMTQAVGLVAEIVAERAGRQADDLAVMTFAGAVIGVATTVMYAHAQSRQADIPTLLDQALAQLEHGFDL